MAFHRLSDFLRFLEKKKDLLRIKCEVDPHLEITEIATRVVKQKGPALLFENPRGSSVPLLINVLGAERRIEWALGRSPQQVGEQLARFAHQLMPPTPQKLWHERNTLKRIFAMRQSRVHRAPCMARSIEPANLNVLPLAQSWPKDGGRFITFPLVYTKSPIDGKQNIGVYRMQVYDENKTGMHWQIAKGGGYHYQQAEAQNKPLPLAVVLGADPLLMMCGVLPLPEGLDEMAFSGFLRGSPTRTTRVCGGALSVPAEAEIVLEGFVPPNERRIEGPYGDHFGHYSHEAPFPVFHVKKIWHRKKPIYPIAVVGKPPQEDQVIGDAVQEILLPLLKIMHPEIVDLWAYQEAGFHNLLVVSVNQRFAKEALKTALWVLGEGQLALTKCVILVDPDVNARNFNQIMRAVGRHFDPKEDFILLPKTSQDTLDFTSFKMNLGSKMILDATSNQDAVTSSKGVDVSDVREMDHRISDACSIEHTLLVVQVKSHGREVLEKMLTSPRLQSYKLVAAVSSDIPLDNPTLMLWGIFTRFDCDRDTFFAKASIERGRLEYKGPMGIDATWKPGYPEPLVMNEDVIEKVNRRWNEYGFN